MKMFPLVKFARKLGVLALGFWLAGAGCLLGCEGMVTAAAGQESKLSSHSSLTAPIVAEGNACSSSEGHSCCKKKASEVRRRPAVHDANPRVLVRANVPTTQNFTEGRLAESSTNGMNTCPFAISRALAVAKIHDSKMSATAAVSHESPAARVREQKSSLSTLSPMPNRGHTYLSCCAFLI
jgi:hypothetical protein